MSTFNPNSQKLREFVEAYEAGEPREKLAERIGARHENTANTLAGLLVRLGVVAKRKNVVSAEGRAKSVENIRRAHVAMAAERAEFRQWKASRAAAQPLAAE